MNQELLLDAYYQYIISALQAGKDQDAIAKFNEMAPHFKDHPKCATLFNLVYPIQIKKEKEKIIFVLGIGIDRYQKPFNPLNGCVNDAELFIELIREKHSSTSYIEVIFLKNEQATSENIKIELNKILQNADLGDTVVIYFSGYAGQGILAKILNLPQDSDYALATFDTTTPAEKGEKPPAIWGSELHEIIQKIKATNKYLLIDSNTHNEFMSQVEETSNYTVMFGCDDGEMAYERQFDGKTHGVFTYALAAIVREYQAEEAPPLNLYDQVVKYIKDKNFNQTPKMVGDITPLFFPQKDIQPAELIRITQPSARPLTDHYYFRLTDSLQKAKSSSYLAFDISGLNLTGLTTANFFRTPFFPILKKIGQYLLKKGELEKAISFFEKYTNSTANESNELDGLIPLIELYDRLGYYEKAADYLSNWIKKHPEFSEKHPIHLLNKKYQNHKKSDQTKYALIIGIDAYQKVKPLSAAKKDAENWHRYLIETLKIPTENITLLLDETASRKNILAEFEKHAKLANTCPVLFFFAGNGAAYPLEKESPTRALMVSEKQYIANESPFMPALVSVDSRQGKIQDILFNQLFDLQIKHQSKFLTCILDIGFEEETGSRGVKPQELKTRGPMRLEAEPSAIRTANAIAQGIGNLSILPGAVKPGGNLAEKTKLHCIETDQGGLFSNTLLDILRSKPGLSYRFSQLYKELYKKKIGSLGDRYQIPVAIGDPEFLMFNYFKLGETEIEAIKNLSLQNLKALLEQHIGSNWGNFPDNQVVLALTEALLGHPEKATAMLSAALSDGTKEEQRQVKANYHLGRVLVESSSSENNEHWSQALNALRAATEARPNFAPAYYYLGKAIHQISILEGRSEAVKAFTKYKDNKYPLGHQEEVDQYLDSLDEGRQRKRFMSEGIRLLEKKELAEAERCFQEARLLGENAAFYYMGEIYNKQGDYLRALNSYNQAKLLGVAKEDTGYKMGDMVRRLLTNSGIIQNIRDDVQAYQDNPYILKYSDTETLLDNLTKIQAHLDTLHIGWR